MRLLRVLCVEDNQDDFDLVKLLLQELARGVGEACFVERARNASLACKMVDGSSFDVFIVDQTLEGNDMGTDFLRHLLERCPEAPILFVTHDKSLDVENPLIQDLDADKLAILYKGKLSLEALRDNLHRLGVDVFEQNEA